VSDGHATLLLSSQACHFTRCISTYACLAGAGASNKNPHSLPSSFRFYASHTPARSFAHVRVLVHFLSRPPCVAMQAVATVNLSCSRFSKLSVICKISSCSASVWFVGLCERPDIHDRTWLNFTLQFLHECAMGAAASSHSYSDTCLCLFEFGHRSVSTSTFSFHIQRCMAHPSRLACCSFASLCG
jgi:hypothetical protein